MHVDSLLSDKFAEYSGNITALHEKKKELTADFKKVLDQHRSAIKEIDDEAVSAHAAFIEWQTAHDRPHTPKESS